MSQIKRIKLLEKHYGAGVDPGAEAVILYRADHSLRAAPPEPVTIFTVGGREIRRRPEELYQEFENRALKDAWEHLPHRRPGAAAPVPVLHANGSLQQ